MSADSTTELAVTREYDSVHIPPSIAIIEAIADIKNTEPAELSKSRELMLNDYIDVEALDHLLTGETSVSVSFTVERYQIRIDNETLAIRLA